jgi:hypothetical protein
LFNLAVNFTVIGIILYYFIVKKNKRLKEIRKMEIEIRKVNGVDLAEVISDRIIIKETQDALDLMANISYQGSNKIIMNEKNIIPDFFDLKTKIAGEILQKFSTYNVYLAIIGDFSKYSSKSLRDFIFESNKTGRINFVNSLEEAIGRLSKN